MCFAHFGTASEGMHVHAGIGPAAARTFAEREEGGGLSTTDVGGSDSPGSDALDVGRPARTL